MIEFADVEAAVKAVKNFLKAGDVVLLKASRASRLERIAETFEVGKIVKNLKMLYYLSQHLLDWSHGTAWENRLSCVAAFPLHHGAQRGRGDHGADFKLVARSENHSLAEDN